MNSNVEKKGNNVVISLVGQLTSSDRMDFESVVADVFSSGAKMVELDLAELSYMDSVGLGMLVTLRDEAERNDAVVELVDPRGNVKMLLEMARFDILFTIR